MLTRFKFVFLRFAAIRLICLLIFVCNCLSESWGAAPAEISGLDLTKGKNLLIDLKKPKLGTVVAFLSTRCPCSASHQPVLNEIYKEFVPAGFQFIGIHSNANEDLEEAKAFFKKAGLAFPVIQDDQSALADRYQAFKTPHVYIISPTQEILFQGGVDNSKLAEKATRFYLKDALQAIRQGKKPPEKEVRVLGCEIKRP
jgi:peroxiredoxin